jgi:hypothetical protein
VRRKEGFQAPQAAKLRDLLMHALFECSAA